ncbi:hypothetical protein BC939DRAFT_83289 [Gamsiella multidivaricata]|uniref:uncharacterized protein n=1 Tax=Gamsiella multidivaricata TaxID=101098 RepID=UPI0022210B21|nr:uncharacterized protein BC939DRAFT_83289 [Gamsiella multidivaricata]KAI7815833.1 hypothetical protein BC939DRAFT_83289 [Gamsiella multidivaricata]
MLRSIMTTSTLNLFCLVDGDKTTFSVEIDPTKSVDHLKDLVKAKQTPDFDDITAKDLTLWRVSIPIVPKSERKEILLADAASKEELDETDDIADVFTDTPPKKTIHIIVQRPPPKVHAPVPSRSLTPLPGYPSDGSRPSSPLSGDLRADIKKIADRFFAPGSPASAFLDAYVRGEKALPVTTTGIKGLPKVLRRGVVDSKDSGPSLLFLDLPSPPLNVGDPIPERFQSNVLLSTLEGPKLPSELFKRKLGHSPSLSSHVYGCFLGPIQDAL